MRKKIMTLIMALTILSLVSTFAVAGNTIDIGLMCGLTGPFASEGQEMKKIVELLASDLNSSGGVLGKKIRIYVEDDGSDPKTSALAAQRLVSRSVVAVIGTYGSSITEASQSIYNESKIIQIANGSTLVRLTEKGYKYFFRTCPRDDEQGKVSAQTLLDRGYKRIALLHDNSSHGKGIIDQIKEIIDTKGDQTKIVFNNALTAGDKDYTAVLTLIKDANPDAIYFAGYYPEGGMLLRQKYEMGWKIPFIASDGCSHKDIVKVAGEEAAEGFNYLSPPIPEDLSTKNAKDFLSSYTKKYNKLPGSIWTVLSGDGFLVIVEAIRQTKSTDPDVLANYLKDTNSKFNGLTGDIKFDQRGDRAGEVYKVYRIGAKGVAKITE